MKCAGVCRSVQEWSEWSKWSGFQHVTSLHENLNNFKRKWYKRSEWSSVQTWYLYKIIWQIFGDYFKVWRNDNGRQDNVQEYQDVQVCKMILLFRNHCVLRTFKDSTKQKYKAKDIEMCRSVQEWSEWSKWSSLQHVTTLHENLNNFKRKL